MGKALNVAATQEGESLFSHLILILGCWAEAGTQVLQGNVREPNFEHPFHLQQSAQVSLPAREEADDSQDKVRG